MILARTRGDLEPLLDLLSSLTASSPDGIGIKDTVGRFLLINPAGARNLGKRVDEIVGRVDRELFPPAMAARILTTAMVILHPFAFKSKLRSHADGLRTPRPHRTSLPAEKFVGSVLTLDLELADGSRPLSLRSRQTFPTSLRLDSVLKAEVFFGHFADLAADGERGGRAG